MLGRLSGRACFWNVELLEHDVVERLFFQKERYLVDRFGVQRSDNGARLDVTETGDLSAHFLVQGVLGAANEQVGLQAMREQRFHRMLGRLGLELAGSLQVRHQGKVCRMSVLSCPRS